MNIDEVGAELATLPAWLRWLLINVADRRVAHRRLRFRFKELFEPGVAGSAGPVPSAPEWFYHCSGQGVVLAGPEGMFVVATDRDAETIWFPDLQESLFGDGTESGDVNRWLPGPAILGCAMNSLVEHSFATHAAVAMPLPGGGRGPSCLMPSEQCNAVLEWLARADEAARAELTQDWPTEPGESWDAWLLEIAALPDAGALEEVGRALGPAKLREVSEAALQGPLSTAAAHALSFAAEHGQVLVEDEIAALLRQIDSALDANLITPAVKIASIAACAPSLRDDALDRLVDLGLNTWTVGSDPEFAPEATPWGWPPASMPELMYTLLLHDSGRALPVIRRFMKNQVLASRTAAMLNAVDVPWALREIELAAVESGDRAYEVVLLEYLLQHKHTFAHRRLVERLGHDPYADFDAEQLAELQELGEQFAPTGSDDVRDGSLADVKVPEEP